MLGLILHTVLETLFFWIDRPKRSVSLWRTLGAAMLWTLAIVVTIGLTSIAVSALSD